MIKVSNLHVALGGRPVLDNVNFELSRGDFLAVLGPNGGGKSTLIRSILGLVEPGNGTIRIASGSGEHGGHSTTLGYVPQIKSLDRTFPALSIELVLTSILKRWPGRVSSQNRLIAIQALEKVGAEHLAERAISDLSGGEMQRVYLARTLLQSPDIILLDEPATGIDAAGSADLYAVLDRFRVEKNGLIIMVTHDWDVAFHHASHALLLKRRQICFGKPSKVLTSSVIREAFGHMGHKHAVLAGLSGHSDESGHLDLLGHSDHDASD